MVKASDFARSDAAGAPPGTKPEEESVYYPDTPEGRARRLDDWWWGRSDEYGYALPRFATNLRSDKPYAVRLARWKVVHEPGALEHAEWRAAPWLADDPLLQADNSEV